MSGNMCICLLSIDFRSALCITISMVRWTHEDIELPIIYLVGSPQRVSVYSIFYFFSLSHLLPKTWFVSV